MAGRKTAVVVGGSSGIGLAVAEALAARGEAVVVTSRDPMKAEAAAARWATAQRRSSSILRGRTRSRSASPALARSIIS